jgi:hypothetical protein
MSIPLGYEIGSGNRVNIPVNHTVVLGQTQLSGKTTTLEAMVMRSGLRAISFITKPGEKGFRQQAQIPPFFSESTSSEYWKYVVAIVENLMGDGRESFRLGWQERGWIVKLCQDYEREKTKSLPAYKWKKPKTLSDLLANVEKALPQLRGTSEMVCFQLREYLRPAIEEIEDIEFSDKLNLQPGINVMNITRLSDGLKALVIRSVIEQVHKHGRKTVVIIPEAWKFIPEGRSTPVKLALEGLIREGAGVGNFVWMDSQDLRGVDKKLLRSVIVWLFGVQRQRNEVANTLDSIPDHPKPSATEIMQLGKGEFYVCYGSTLLRTYVQPAGMEDAHAEAIALGQERPESWKAIAESLDSEISSESGDGSLGERDVSDMDGDRRGGQPGDSNKDLQEAPAVSGASDSEDLARAEEIAGGESDHMEQTYKEKYIALRVEFDQLRDAHDALAERIRLSEAAGETVLRVPSKSSPESLPARGTAPGTGEKAAQEGASRAASSNGSRSFPLHSSDVRLLFEQFAEMAKKDPVILHILQERPELKVTREIKTVQAHASTLKGALGILISEKFFDAARPFDDVRKEFIRRGFIAVKTPSRQIEGAIDSLVEMGFLTKEETGLLAVPGMKVNIVEARG